VYITAREGEGLAGPSSPSRFGIKTIPVERQPLLEEAGNYQRITQSVEDSRWF